MTGKQINLKLLKIFIQLNGDKLAVDNLFIKLSSFKIKEKKLQIFSNVGT